MLAVASNQARFLSQLSGLFTVVLLIIPVCAPAQDAPPISGGAAFMGYAPPGTKPEVFAADVLSGVALPHSRLLVAPDGSKLYFNGNPAPNVPGVLYSASFDGISLLPPVQVDEVHPFYSAKFEYSFDANRLFVAYRIEAPSEENVGEIPVLVYMERTSDGWGEPVPIIENSNGEWASFGQPSLTRNGTLYLGARRSDTRAPTIIRIAETELGYGRPEEVIGATGGMPAADAFIDPDENFMLFAGFEEGGYGALDLYVSFRDPDGTWSAPTNLGEELCTEHHERFPSVSADGRFLFFVRGLGESFGTAGGDFYWVSAEILERYSN